MPATTDATPSLFVMRRSADGVTASVSVSLSFAGSFVAGDDVTETVFASGRRVA